MSSTTPTVPIRPFPYLWRLVWSQPGFALQSLFLILLMALVNLPLPLLNKVAIDHAIPAGEMLPLIALGVLAFLVRGLASGFQVLQNFVIWRLMDGVAHGLRTAMVRTMLQAPFGRYSDGEIAGYVGRLSSDVTSIQAMIYDTFRFIIRPIAMIIVVVLVMGLVSLPITALILIVTPLSVLLTRHLAKDLHDKQKAILEQRQGLQATVAEILENVRVIRAYTREERYQRLVADQAATYTEAAVTHATRQQFLQSVIDFLNLLPWLVLVAVGSWMVQTGAISIGDFLMFIAFEQSLRSPFGQFAYYLLHIKAEMAAPERVEEVIAVPAEQAVPPTSATSTSLSGILELHAVQFAYPNGKTVFEGLDLRVAAGERVAIVGPSGAGKTTLFNLLLGFYAPQHGRIRFDDQDLVGWDLRELRRQLGIVFQHNPLFDGSIRENLLLDRPDLDEEALWRALADADSAEFVRSLPDGLDTRIGVKGMKLSGGQRQRLAIARTLLRDPKLILLDEATSSLDSVSEQHIQAALDRLLTGRSSLTIAHRLSTVVKSDRICYLEGGRIVESGSHQELLNKRGKYFALYQAQVDGLLPG